MTKIIPHLWFDKEALEAARWYVSLFEGSAITEVHQFPGTPSGDVESVSFRLANMDFQAISAGPYYKFNTSVSFMVSCKTAEEVDRLYAQLSSGGTELMKLGEYPFSKRYCWLQDRYGLNWQLMLTENAEEHVKIRPTLLFEGDACGRAEDAMEFYQSVFPRSGMGFVNRYAPGEAMDPRAGINYGEFNVDDMQLVMMDHGMGGEDDFNEAISFMVLCKDQHEIDEYWGKLSYVPEAEQCGWLKDRFGVSWQIVPANMGDLLAGGSEEEVGKIMGVFLKMKKIDIVALKEMRSF
jgi:predicted 3-demethylubiquinone-9 3-methyltransferase (glyoxalase superfamily)